MRINKKDNIYPVVFGIVFLLIWQILCSVKIIPSYLMPSPLQIVMALVEDFTLLMYHLVYTLAESILGLVLGVILGLIFALLMDRFLKLYKIFYPFIIISQTIPTIAIAPLLVLWFGYDLLPKIILIVLVTFFPITIGVFESFKSTDKDEINLLKSMGASEFDIYRFIKLPSSMGKFFAALKISASYSVVGGVISEWLGGFRGLGVYMTRVRKAYAFDKMFAVIIIISILSLLLLKAVDLLQKISMPWEEKNEKNN